MSELEKYKKRLIVILLLLLFVTQASTDIYVAGLPTMAKEFGVTPARMNLTITYYVYAQACLFLIMGPISDLFGRRKTILIGLLISLCATFLISESNSLTFIIFLRIFQAIGSASIYIVSRLIIKEVYNKNELLSVTGLFLIGLVLSPALAPVVGAFIIKHLDWRWSFRILGVMLIVLWCFAFIVIKESNLNVHKYRKDFMLSKMLCNYANVITNRLFLHYTVIVGGTFASFYAFISMSSYMYINEYHISSIYYSYLFTFIALGYLLGNKVMTYLNKSGVRPYNLVLVGIIIAVIVILLTLISIPFRNNLLVFIAMVTISGWLIRLATAFINPPIQVGVINAFPKNSSYAVGLLSSLQYVFAAFGSWFVGILPFEPSSNIIISTIVFSLVSLSAFLLIKPSELK